MFQVDDLNRVDVRPGDVFLATVPEQVREDDLPGFRALWHGDVGAGLLLLVRTDGTGPGQELAVYRKEG